MRIELENPNNKAISQASKTIDNDDSNNEHNEDKDEANMDEVISKLVPSCVTLAKRTHELIYLTLHLHNLTNICTGMTVRLFELVNSLNDPKIIAHFHHFLGQQDLVNKDQMEYSDHHKDPNVSVVSSATSTYFAPSNQCGITGVKRELMCATPSWRKNSPHYDTVLVRTGLLPGPHSLLVAQLRFLFSFSIAGTRHEVALVEWFTYIGNSPDEDTGMWVVEREKWDDGSPLMDFIYVHMILWNCHLIPMYGSEVLSRNITHVTSLDVFQAYYVNKFADHHSFELLS